MNCLQAIEPLELEDLSELFSVEPAPDSCIFASNIGLPASEPGKWSSLAVALLIHCFLLAVFLAATSSKPLRRHDWMEVQLVASSGGSKGHGGGASKPSVEAGGKGAAEVASHSAPALKRAPAHVTASKENESLEKRPVHAAWGVRRTRRVMVRKRTLKKKIATAKVRRPEEKEALRSKCTKAREKSAPGGSDIARAVHGAERNAVPSAAPGHSGQQAGSAGHGAAGGGGAMEVGFGSPDGPRFLHRVIPSYPEFAQEQEMQGTVFLRVEIDEHGRVVNVKVLKKAGFGFDEAAVKAIRESTFIPAKNEGKCCGCMVLIPIRFELQ